MQSFWNMLGLSKNETETNPFDKDLRDRTLRNAATADDGTFAQDATLLDNARESKVFERKASDLVYEDAYDIIRNTNDLRLEKPLVMDRDILGLKSYATDGSYVTDDSLTRRGRSIRVEEPTLLKTTTVLEKPLATLPLARDTLDRTHVLGKNVVERTTLARDETAWEEHDSQKIIEKAPILHETYRTERLEEIQPVIHREIEQPEYHRVAQPIYEKEVKNTAFEEKTLLAQYRETVVQKPSAAFVSAHESFPDKSSKDFLNTNSVIEKEPIIIEHRHKTVFEEIQPIIHREVVQPQIVKETLPIYEKYVEAPVIIDEVREAKYIDSRQGVLPTAIRRV